MSAARLFIALMDLMKLQVLTSFCFMVAGRSSPVVGFSAAFLLALGLNRLLRTGELRAIVYLLANALGLALAYFFIGSRYLGLPFDPRTLVFGDTLFPRLAIPAWSAIFWLRGEWFARKKADHPFCAARFDESVAVILLALCVAAGFKASNPLAERLVLPGILFGLFALGAAKRETARPGGLARGSGKGGVVGAAAAFCLSSIGILALTPVFLDPAQSAGELINRAFRGISPHLAAFLRRILGLRSRSGPVESSASQGVVSDLPYAPTGTGNAGRILARILLWALGMAGAFLMAFLLTLALTALFRSLRRKVKKDEDGLWPSLLPAWLRALWENLARRASRLRKFLFGPKRRLTAAQAAYVRYLACGRGTGRARRPQETPREYALRLAEAYPRSASRAPFVAEALERETYGRQILDPSTERTLVSIRKSTLRFSFLAERLRTVRRGPAPKD